MNRIEDDFKAICCTSNTISTGIISSARFISSRRCQAFTLSALVSAAELIAFA